MAVQQDRRSQVSVDTLEAPKAPKAPKVKKKRSSEALLGRSPQDTGAGFFNYLLLGFVIFIGMWPIYWAGVISTWKGEDKVYSDGVPQLLPDFSGQGLKFNWDVITEKIHPD